MNEFIEICKEVAPVVSVMSGLITVALIPILSKLNAIHSQINTVQTWCNGHEKLDDARFKAHETRLNDVLQQSGG